MSAAQDILSLETPARRSSGLGPAHCSRVAPAASKKKIGKTLDNTQQLGIFKGMKSIFSPLAERQTVRMNNINARVSVRVRAWKSGEQTETTNDVMVDGYCYTPAVSDNWLSQNLAKICDIVAGKAENHIGMGQWV